MSDEKLDLREIIISLTTDMNIGCAPCLIPIAATNLHTLRCGSGNSVGNHVLIPLDEQERNFAVVKTKMPESTPFAAKDIPSGNVGFHQRQNQNKISSTGIRQGMFGLRGCMLYRDGTQ